MPNCKYCGEPTTRLEWMQIGGMLNAVALAAFIIGTVGAAAGAKRDARRGA